jgi:hypothetical protein
MTSQGGAILRSDLMTVVEEALLSESLYIGTKVMPPLGVDTKNGQYPKLRINSGNMLRDEAKRRAPGANYARTSRKWEQDSYDTIEYGLESPVDDSSAADIGRFFSLETTEARLTQRQLLLGHERRVASAIFAPTVFGLTTSATAYTVANLGTFDIAFDIDLAKLSIKGRGESTAAAGLIAVMSENVFLRARQSTRLQNRIRGTVSTDTNLVLQPADLAAAFGVREVLVASASYDSSATGASSSTIADIWGNTYCWIGQALAGAPEAGGAARTLFWKENGGLVTVESYREEQTRSNIIRVRHDTAEKIINANAGQLLVTQYS